jgi:hypothetical protein
MQAHRFAVGEVVLYAEKRHPHFTWKAPYTIVSCMSVEATEPQYRIASIHHHGIRIAGEHELCRTPQPLPAAQQSLEPFFEIPSCLQPANLNLDSIAKRPLVPWLQHSTSGAHDV